MEDKSIMDKTMDELTVAEIIKVNVAIPVIMMGGVAVAWGVAAGASRAKEKFETFRRNRQEKNEQE